MLDEAIRSEALQRAQALADSFARGNVRACVAVVLNDGESIVGVTSLMNGTRDVAIATAMEFQNIEEVILEQVAEQDGCSSIL